MNKFILFILVSLVLSEPDPNFHVYLAFGQSNMEGYGQIEAQDTANVPERFKMMAAVDFPKSGRKKGNWYTAVPPLCKEGNGLSPCDYFGRELVENLPDVSDINQFCKVNDVFKMKIMNISEDGKISLSIKKAQDPPPREKVEKKPRVRKEKPQPTMDSSYVWTPQKHGCWRPMEMLYTKQ